jgi:hypothetical protein
MFQLYPAWARPIKDQPMLSPNPSRYHPSDHHRSPSFLICWSLPFSCEPAKEQTSTYGCSSIGGFFLHYPHTLFELNITLTLMCRAAIPHKMNRHRTISYKQSSTSLRRFGVHWWWRTDSIRGAPRLLFAVDLFGWLSIFTKSKSWQTKTFIYHQLVYYIAKELAHQYL